MSGIKPKIGYHPLKGDRRTITENGSKPITFLFNWNVPTNFFKWRAEYPDIVDWLNQVAEQNRKLGKPNELIEKVKDKVKW